VGQVVEGFFGGSTEALLEQIGAPGRDSVSRRPAEIVHPSGKEAAVRDEPVATRMDATLL
jgi:hypothetical protein